MTLIRVLVQRTTERLRENPTLCLPRKPQKIMLLQRGVPEVARGQELGLSQE